MTVPPFTYAQRRFMLLVELRLLRRTDASKRVVKHVQREMRKLRTYRRMMEEGMFPVTEALRTDPEAAP